MPTCVSSTKNIFFNRKKIPCFFHDLCYSVCMKDKENTTFNVNGTLCTLVVSEDREDDCTKLWHDLVSVDTGKVVATLDWSPYSCPSDTEVQQLIDLADTRFGFTLPEGLRWSSSHPSSRFNFDSKTLAQYLAGYEHPQGGKLELVFRVRHANAA